MRSDIPLQKMATVKPKAIDYRANRDGAAANRHERTKRVSDRLGIHTRPPSGPTSAEPFISRRRGAPCGIAGFFPTLAGQGQDLAGDDVTVIFRERRFSGWSDGQRKGADLPRWGICGTHLRDWRTRLTIVNQASFCSFFLGGEKTKTKTPCNLCFFPVRMLQEDQCVCQPQIG